MRYYLRKIFYYHPIRSIVWPLLIGASLIAFICNQVAVVVLLLIFWITDIIIFCFDDFDSDELEKNFSKNLDVTKYAKRYRKNPKILEEIYKIELERIEGFIEEILFEACYREGFYLQKRKLRECIDYYREHLLLLNEPAHRNLFNKLYELRNHVNQGLNDFYSEEEKQTVRTVLQKDLKRLTCEFEENIKNTIGKGKIKSIFDQAPQEDAKKNLLVETAIKVLKNCECEETISKLKKIENEVVLPTKCKIILEEIILHCNTKDFSSNPVYQKEFKEMMELFNSYLDQILNSNDIENRILSIKALKSYIGNEKLSN